MLVSSCPGRLRFRDGKLCDAEFASDLASRIEGLEGVVEVCSNLRAGSLLIVYEPERLARESILAEAEAVASSYPAAGGASIGALFSSRRGRAAVKAGMAASVAGALLALALSERMHAALGASFVLFAAAHLTQNRRTLFR